MDDRELFWLAGLLEGEGYFHAANDGRNTYPRITVAMNDYDIVKRCADMFGVSVGKLKGRSDTHAEFYYRCVVTGRPAVEWMNKILPLMGERRRLKINTILSEWTEPTRSPRKRRESVGFVHTL